MGFRNSTIDDRRRIYYKNCRSTIRIRLYSSEIIENRMAEDVDRFARVTPNYRGCVVWCAVHDRTASFQWSAPLE